MQDSETETLADRLNQEPVIFRGSTHSELGIILLCAVVFWIPFGFIVAALLGAVVMGLGISSLGVLITIVVGSTVFQRIKRGKPDNYYQHQVIIKLDQLKLRKSGLIAPQPCLTMLCVSCQSWPGMCISRCFDIELGRRKKIQLV